jgi:hypothetical protein
MKNLKYLFSCIFMVAIFSCNKEDDNLDYLDSAEAPNNLSALVTITNDNSGKVTIQPNGQGATMYTVYYGDTANTSENVSPGGKLQHTYAEGVYNMKIVATTVNGSQTEYIQPITVSFIAPTNLVVTATPEIGNAYKLNVTASANYETFFTVYFGESPTEVPQQFNEGQTVSHTYAAVGAYTLKVIAHSGGVATTVNTQTITVFDPLLFPITFESTTLNYNFVNFGNATSTVVNNPSISGGNTTAKVGRLNKAVGAEVWAGSFLQLDQPIDLSVLKKIKLRSYSPKVGATIKLKLENLTDGNINREVDVLTTVANDWEDLIFDFTGINTANTYQKVVIFYDFGVAGNGANYYFDDLKQTNASAQLELPLTFQNASLNYNFLGFGGANTAVITNPNQTGINTSTQVARSIKNVGSETWAGSFIELAEPIDFSALNKIKIKVWSPQVGAVVLLKLENSANNTINIERTATTTVANAWQELTYDFSGIVSSNNYQKVVIFFNFGTAGNGASYYFDDVKLSN